MKLRRNYPNLLKGFRTPRQEFYAVPVQGELIARPFGQQARNITGRQPHVNESPDRITPAGACHEERCS